MRKGPIGISMVIISMASESTYTHSCWFDGPWMNRCFSGVVVASSLIGTGVKRDPQGISFTTPAGVEQSACLNLLLHSNNSYM